MILTSLLTLFGALLPVLLGQFDASVSSVWRSSALVLAFVTATQLFAVASSRPAAVPVRPQMRQPVTIILLALSCASVLLQSLIAAGFLLEAAAPLYSTSVSYLLFLSAYHFFRLIQAVQPA